MSMFCSRPVPASLEAMYVRDWKDLWGEESIALPDQSCVHPWHPIGHARNEKNEIQSSVNLHLNLQREIYQESNKLGHVHWSERREKVEAVYDKNRKLVDSVIAQEKCDKNRSSSIPKGQKVYPSLISCLKDRYF